MTAYNASHQVKTLYSTCSLRELCLPTGLTSNEFSQLDAIVWQSRRLRKGRFLFRVREPFTSLFTIRVGFFKTIAANQDKRDQATGFFISGELIGMDGVCSYTHSCDVVTLEGSEVHRPLSGHIEELGQNIPSLQTHLLRLLSREIVCDQDVVLLLDNMRAGERLAVFLLNLSNRLYSRGFAANGFVLHMSHEEIGGYLGLRLETVSYTLSKFHHDGLIKVGHKYIKISEPQVLKKMVSGCTHAM